QPLFLRQLPAHLRHFSLPSEGDSRSQSKEVLPASLIPGPPGIFVPTAALVPRPGPPGILEPGQPVQLPCPLSYRQAGTGGPGLATSAVGQAQAVAPNLDGTPRPQFCHMCGFHRALGGFFCHNCGAAVSVFQLRSPFTGVMLNSISL
ncbi:unnamed protein product, partial [Polarella glacialis]